MTIKRALVDTHTFFTDLLCLCVGCRVNAVVFVVHLGPTFEFKMEEEHLRLTLNGEYRYSLHCKKNKIVPT